MSLEQKMKEPYFLHVDTNCYKLKVDQKNFWLGMVKNGFGQSGHRTVSRWTVSQEYINGVSRFF